MKTGFFQLKRKINMFLDKVYQICCLRNITEIVMFTTFSMCLREENVINIK